MKFNSQICTTREQSERLLALGLKKETADMTYFNDKICSAAYNEMECPYDDLVHPAWSLHRLIYLIPNEYFTDLDFQDIMQRCIFATSTLYDDLIDLIEALIKQEYFYKEYLEE